MSALTDRRAAWAAKEAVRAEFFHLNGELNAMAIAAHIREGLRLDVAEGIAAGTGWSGEMSKGGPIDLSLISEAEALAAAE